MKSNSENREVADLTNKALKAFKSGAIEEASFLLNRAHSIDFENPQLFTALKCTRFWTVRFDRLEGESEPYDKAEFLVEQWFLFKQAFVPTLNDPFERGIYALKQGIFRTALKYYSRVNEGGKDLQPEILLRMGRCYKALGDYETAILTLEKGIIRDRRSPGLLAELADSYFMIDRIRNGKVFFREAFFLGASNVDLKWIESDMILSLVDKLKEMGFKGDELKEWLPVYAVLFGIFNVKRELKPIEYGKLKQSIYALKNELNEKKQSKILQPRLINHYFWLMDHYLSTGEDRQTVEEVLLNIKLLNLSIYEQYTN